jgi:hypothetical protein
VPATYLAREWIAAVEAGASRGDWARTGAALASARNLEREMFARLEAEGLTVHNGVAFAQVSLMRRLLEAELIAVPLAAKAPDAALQLSVALHAHEERVKQALRFFVRFLSKQREVADAASREALTRRRLAALRHAEVEVKGADQILPGRYNGVEVRMRLPASAPSGGMASAAVALPSELWIVASDTAGIVRGQYVLAALPLEPGASASWKVDLYVPDRAGGEPGAIEVRIGFEPDGEEKGQPPASAAVPEGGEPA